MFPKEGNPKPMSAADASSMVRRMIHSEAHGPGDYENAMDRLQARYGIGFWQLDHLRKGKAKTCEVGLFARIHAAFIDHCGAQAARLLHEAEIAKRTTPDVHLDDIEDQIRTLAARLANAKAAAKNRRETT